MHHSNRQGHLLSPWFPRLQTAVLKACVGLGLRLGSLVASAALFGPALFLWVVFRLFWSACLPRK